MEQLGAKVVKAVSRSTDVVLCGDKVGPKKLEKARALGVAVMDEREWVRHVKGLCGLKLDDGDDSDDAGLRQLIVEIGGEDDILNG